MRTTIKFILPGILMIAVSILLSNCKSSSEPEETSEVESSDTTATDMDMPEEIEETADAEEPDADVAPDKVVAARVPLTLIIKNLASATGPVYVSIYGTKSKFPSPKGQLKEHQFIPKGNELIAKITDLKYGTYAVATYQDENSNGKIDKNFIGMPTEGFGFSNNYKPKIKAPAFKDCKFAYNEKNNTITISMIR